MTTINSNSIPPISVGACEGCEGVERSRRCVAHNNFNLKNTRINHNFINNTHTEMLSQLLHSHIPAQNSARVPLLLSQLSQQ